MKKKNSNLGFAILVVMLVAASAFSLQLFMCERTAHDVVKIEKFPMNVGEWKGRDLPITEKEYDILETRNIITREYVNPRGERLYLLVVYSETNRSVFHPPEVCLLGSGTTMTDKQVDTVDGDKQKFSTNKLSLAKGGQNEVMLYSYKAGNLYTDSYYLQQLYLAFHQVFGKRVPGATVRVSMRVAGGEEKTVGVLKGFLSKAARIVDELSSASRP